MLKGMSQRQLGNLVGSISSINKCERGEYLPNKKLSMQLAEIFKTGSKYYYDDFFEKSDNFSLTISQILHKNNLSRRSLSNILGVSHQTIQRWLDGDIPTRSTYYKIESNLKKLI